MPRILLNERGAVMVAIFFLWKIVVLSVDTGGQFVSEVSQQSNNSCNRNDLQACIRIFNPDMKMLSVSE